MIPAPQELAEALECADLDAIGCGNRHESILAAAYRAAIAERDAMTDDRDAWTRRESPLIKRLEHRALAAESALEAARKELAKIGQAHREMGADYLTRTKERDEARAEVKRLKIRLIGTVDWDMATHREKVAALTSRIAELEKSKTQLFDTCNSNENVFRQHEDFLHSENAKLSARIKVLTDALESARPVTEKIADAIKPASQENDRG